jgi:hypothetical protein
MLAEVYNWFTEGFGTRSHQFNSYGLDPLLNPLLTCPTGSDDLQRFPWDTAPHYLLRDRDASYGSYFCNRIEAMGSLKSSLRRAPRGRTPTSSA